MKHVVLPFILLFSALFLLNSSLPTAVGAPLATIFDESMYDGTGGANGNAISTHEANNRFANDDLTMSGTGDMRTTSPSATSDYPAASGTWNVMLNFNGEYFQIADINTNDYTNLSLSFGVRKNTNAEDGSGLTVAVSSDGTNWTTLTVPALPTGSGTARWHYRTATGSIPSAANLRIRFTSTNGVEWRIDDVLLTGDIAGDVPPTVSSTSPASAATDVPLDSNISITFSEAVTVNGNWFQIACADSGPRDVDDTAVSGGPTTFLINPNIDFDEDETCTVTIYAAQVVDQDDTPNNMATDYSWSFTTLNTTPVCDQPASHYIHQVQGSGMVSPLVGQTVTVQAVVVGDFQDTLNGFFIQEEDADRDADPTTSEGIFVFSTTPVEAGQRVRVTGNVTEFFGLTQIASSPTVTICDLDAWDEVSPATFELPFPAPVGGVDYLERYEGMLVTLPQTLYVTNNYLLGRAGELTLSFGARLPQPTNVALPGAPAAAQLALNQLNQIVIDDGSTSQNPDPVIYPAPTGLSYTNTARGGDAVSDIVGVLTYSWSGFTVSGNSTDAYRIHTTAVPTFTPSNPRSATPPNVGGNVQVASFNVLNYFTTLDTGPNICGPAGNMGCRGANSAVEFERQYTKIVNAIVEIDAAVIGLMEIENHATDNAVIDLVSRLNAVAGAGTYAYINTGVVGTDAIKQAIIYQPAMVTPVGSHTLLNGAIDARFNDGKNRPVIIQTFVEPDSGARFTVAVNHLKSKGSACVDVGDPDAGDGQGNCNGVRTAAAEALVDYLATDPTNSNSDFFLIIGDLNAYAMEDPIMVIQNAGYTNLVSHFGGLYAYGYQFGGQWGYLDHALASDELFPFVTGTAEWHLNADEPIALDYNVEFKSPGQITSFYGSGPFRSSDHDPVIVGLNLQPNQSTLPASYGAAWHTGHGELRLGTAWSRGADTDSNDGVAIGAGSGVGGQWQDGANGGSLDIVVTDTSGGLATGCLYAWIDWDQNGVFDDPAERVISEEVGGSGNYSFTVPDDTFDVPGGPITKTPEMYNMRVRLYETCASSPIGAALGGEVEDLGQEFSPTAVTLSQQQQTTPTTASTTLWLIAGLLTFTTAFLLRRRTI